MPDEKTNSRAERIIAEAKKRFQQCVDAEADIRRKCLDDLEFLAGNQWSDQALRERALAQRPALVINRLAQFVLHISNAQKQNRISAKVFPVDDRGDIETAEKKQGVVRHIEYNSHGTLAYDTGAFYAVAMGFGYWRQITEYSDPLSFDQDVKLERIQNPFQVYLGPHTMPDGSDAKFGFIVTPYTRDEFKAEYPKADFTGLEWASGTGDSGGWIGQDEIRVVEYYTTEYQDELLVQMADGSTRLLSELEEADKPLIAKDAEGEPIQRETRIPSVKWYKLNAKEILDETDWPIPKIPIVKVIGQELTVNGKLILQGIVRNMKDSQRQFNKLISDQTEAVDSSKGQVVGYEGQFEGHEEEWRNLSRQQVLQVKPTTIGGQPAPLPQRLAPNVSIPAMTEARMLAADDLKALVSLYDAALGATSNETSGRGILARQQQSDTANFHFQDNLLLSITHSTKMLVDLIGVVYSGPRVVRIIGENDAQKIVKINQEFNDHGKRKKFDFTVGKYDVVCTAGPNFQTKRQEGARLLIDLVGVAPQLMQIAPDLILKTLDMPYAQELSDRAKKTLPANLQEQPEKQEIPPQVAQQMQQSAQMIDLLTKELNAKNEIIERETLKLESAERIAMAKIDLQRTELQLKLDSAEAIALLKAEIEGIKMQVEINSAQLAEETGTAAQRM
jgi:hypothetical protein